MIFRITPSKKDKVFIKSNRPVLEDMLSRWLWDMKTDALKMLSDTVEERDERDRAIASIKFIESLLKTIKIVVNEPPESNTSDI